MGERGVRKFSPCSGGLNRQTAGSFNEIASFKHLCIADSAESCPELFGSNYFEIHSIGKLFK
jgi:hypothetical protein